MTVADSLSEFTAGLEYGALPESVRDAGKLHLLDAVGVAYASASFDFAKTTLDGLKAFGDGDHAVIGMAAKLQLRDAVLMNGILIHGLDFDDTSIFGRVHPSSFVVPCVLGMGAFAKSSGADVLAAYVAGVECAIRIGSVANGGFQRAGFHPTGVVGAFACALAAGRLLRLDPARLTMAQGIVYSAAAGNNEFTANDAWTKRLHSGWAGVAGITAAMLARGGFVGPRTAYEGRFGLYRTYLGPQADCDAGAAIAELGTRWELERVAFKPIASCHFNHPIINSTIALVTEHNLAPADIERIRVLLPEAAVNTVCEPAASKKAPTDVYGAQFSAYYAAACAAVRRRYTLADLRGDSLADPAIRAMSEKIEYAIDAESNFPRHYSGGVEITTLDGRELRRREDVNLGSSERPMTSAQIEAKFLDNARLIVPPARAEAIRDAILDIDRLASVSHLTDQLGLHRNESLSQPTSEAA